MRSRVLSGLARRATARLTAAVCAAGSGTGVAVQVPFRGRRARVAPVLESAGLFCQYDELDPDVFGEELSEPAYADADRIAAVLLTARQGVA